MTIYTAVSEAYDVEVFRSVGAVVARLGNEFALSPEQDKPASNAELKRALKASSSVRLYDLESSDWKYRAEVHR